jgi:hypothetical protein
LVSPKLAKFFDQARKIKKKIKVKEFFFEGVNERNDIFF